MEEHSGQVKEILMRTLSSHITALDRQIQESVNILEGCKVEGQCLNLRNEWGGAKVPRLEVRTPKEVDKARKEGGNPEPGQEGKEKAGHQEEGTEDRQQVLGRTVGLRRIRQD